MGDAAQIRAQSLHDIWIQELSQNYESHACATRTNKQINDTPKTLVPVHPHTQTTTIINPHRIDCEGFD